MQDSDFDPDAAAFRVEKIIEAKKVKHFILLCYKKTFLSFFRLNLKI
jgi:hypothetical protein